MNGCITLIPARWLMPFLVLAASFTSLKIHAASTNTLVFRMPSSQVFELEEDGLATRQAVTPPLWVKAHPAQAPQTTVQLGHRMIVQLRSTNVLSNLLAEGSVKLARKIANDVFVLEAPSALAAAREAARLCQSEDVVVCHPVMKRQAKLLWPYAHKPNDPYFQYQWHMENRDENGQSGGIDINLRSGLAVADGTGITVAVADEGVEVTHPELVLRTAGAPHFNFHSGIEDGTPTSLNHAHGTAVAGLIAAEGNNNRGIIGIAPKAHLASWVIFEDDDYIPSNEAMADLFQYRTDTVWVQNHSWGSASTAPEGPSVVEQLAISNSVHYAREGKGIVIVRAAGNGRGGAQNANDDGYNADPGVIAVAAARLDGRVASYGSQGACILVAAPSADADEGFPRIFTTDITSTNGYNQISFTNDFGDYAFDAYGFGGTSAASPEIAGMAALILSANPSLSYRDVQQILLLSARHYDLADPDLITNGAGFKVSHNLGFGVPDIGVAARLATQWQNRPARTNLTFTVSNPLDIPDAGLHLRIAGTQVPDTLTNIVMAGAESLYPDTPTGALPLVHIGLATAPITEDLHGKAVLIQRGDITFEEKIRNAAEQGAAMAIVYNNRDATDLVHMASTYFETIPAGFIGQNDGEALVALLEQGESLTASFALDAIQYEIDVPDTLQLEHVGLRVAMTHSKRSDVRITVRSPQGTTSIMQQYTFDETPSPTEWYYLSTHHFYESSAGKWTISISDGWPDATGWVDGVTLELFGVPITDTDHDGLDDAWEQRHFGSLAKGPADDPDGDGYSNMREEIMGTNPNGENYALNLDLSIWSDSRLRLSWPGVTNRNYEVWAGSALNTPLTLLTNVAGQWPETEWFAPTTNSPACYYQVRTAPSQGSTTSGK